MPGGFATQHSAVLLQHGKHIAVADLGAQERDPVRQERMLEAEVAHHGTDYGPAQIVLREPVTSDDV